MAKKEAVAYSSTLSRVTSLRHGRGREGSGERVEGEVGEVGGVDTVNWAAVEVLPNAAELLLTY